MQRVPSHSHAVLVAIVLAALGVALALIGYAGNDISQIMSQVTAMVAMYVVKSTPDQPKAIS